MVQSPPTTIPILQASEMPRRKLPKIELPPGVRCVVSKGRPYYYLQLGRGTAKATKAVPIPGNPRNPEWWAAYAEAVNLPPPQTSDNSVARLVAAYKASPEWEENAEKTQYEWTRYLARIEAAWGKLEVRGIEPHHVLALRDDYRETPAAANNMIRCLSAMLAWSVPRKWRGDNPCREVKLFKSGNEYERWPLEMIHLVRDHGPPWMWWATALATFSGQRQGDCLAMRWDQMRDGLLLVKQEKTGARLAIPIHRDLRAVLDQIPKRATTILTSTKGTPWTKDGFKTSWQGAVTGMSRPHKGFTPQPRQKVGGPGIHQASVQHDRELCVRPRQGRIPKRQAAHEGYEPEQSVHRHTHQERKERRSPAPRAPTRCRRQDQAHDLLPAFPREHRFAARVEKSTFYA